VRRGLIITALLLGGCVVDEEPLGYIGGEGDDDDTAEVFTGPFEGWMAAPAPAFYSAPPPGGPESVYQSEDRTNGGGASLMDYTGDGELDLVVTAPWSGSAVYAGDGEGGWTEVPNPDLAAVPMSACAVGLYLDDDDLRDLLLCGDQRVSAWKNEGGAVFSHQGDILEWTGDHPARAEDIAVTDVDGDGTLELYVATQSLAGESPGLPGLHKDALLRHVGGFTFEDLSHLIPEEGGVGQGYASTWVDIDGDRDLDLFSVRDRGDRITPAALFINPGNWTDTWVDVAADWNLALEINGMGVAQADLEGDGTLELVSSDTYSRVHLLRIEDGTALPMASELGAVIQDPETQVESWAVEFVDVENDGDLDLVAAFGRVDPLHQEQPQEAVVWRWEEGELVYDDRLDQELPGIDEAWRTVLPGDLDHDGQLELVFTSHVGNVMVQDPTPTGNGWLRVRLEGPPGNREGLGALVRLDDGTERDLWRRVGIGGSGIHSSVDPTAHFGLGTATPRSIVVEWTDGTVTTVDAPASNQVLTIPHPLAAE